MNDHAASVDCAASNSCASYHIDQLLIIIDGSISWSSNSPHIKTNSDFPETLATAWQQHGSNLVQWLKGSFSLLIIDNSQQQIFAATDRFCSKAIYYQADRLTAEIASYPSMLSGKKPQTVSKLSAQSLYHYCYFHMIPAAESIFLKINKLPAAHYFLWQSGNTVIAPYCIPSFNHSNKASQQEQSATLRRLLKEAVRKSIGDCEHPGAFLSGGLDSSTVTGYMAELTDKGKAYSIGFDAEGYDEMAFARTAANHFGVELKEYYVTPSDIVDALPRLAASAPEPFGNSSLIPAYYCAHMAKVDGVKTMLAGDGGDELFAGNERYLRQQTFSRYLALPKSVRALIDPLAQHLPEKPALLRKIRSYINQANTPLPDRLQTYNFLHHIPAGEMFEASFLTQVEQQLPLIKLREIYWRPDNADELQRMLYHDWQITLADNDLRKVGLACEQANINVCYPMLDSDLCEFSTGLSPSILLAGGQLRAFYKSSLEGWLPKEILQKSKHGFGLPFGLWMRTHKPLQELVYNNIADLATRKVFQQGFLDNAVKLHREGHAAYYGELLWILTSLEFWLKAHLNEQ
ncbi:MAG: asparagine synthetase B family protein [Parahaliea sp.]